jgi:hypothetical protein
VQGTLADACGVDERWAALFFEPIERDVGVALESGGRMRDAGRDFTRRDGLGIRHRADLGPARGE